MYSCELRSCLDNSHSIDPAIEHVLDYRYFPRPTIDGTYHMCPCSPTSKKTSCVVGFQLLEKALLPNGNISEWKKVAVVVAKPVNLPWKHARHAIICNLIPERSGPIEVQKRSCHFALFRIDHKLPSFTQSASSMKVCKLSIAFLIAVMALLSIVTAIDVRNLSDSPSVANAGLPIAAVVGIAAAAAIVVMISVAIKVRSVIRLKNFELHEVVISPNQLSEQPLSVTKQFVYTAHI